MLDVVIALMPAIIVSILFYGWSEILVLAVSAVACVGLEWLIAKFLMKRPELFNGSSALVTGLLLAMNLPCSTPWWVVAIGIAKMSFGGLGQNIFNPAITARVFLLISFPVYMTNWAMPNGFINAVDAVSGATPLGLIKEGLKSGVPIPDILSANGLTASTILRDINGWGHHIEVVSNSRHRLQAVLVADFSLQRYPPCPFQNIVNINIRSDLQLRCVKRLA